MCNKYIKVSPTVRDAPNRLRAGVDGCHPWKCPDVMILLVAHASMKRTGGRNLAAA